MLSYWFGVGVEDSIATGKRLLAGHYQKTKLNYYYLYPRGAPAPLEPP